MKMVVYVHSCVDNRLVDTWTFKRWYGRFYKKVERLKNMGPQNIWFHVFFFSGGSWL